MAQAVSRWLPIAAAGFVPGSGNVGFVVDKVALGQVFSQYLCFPCHSLFHQLLCNQHHLSPGAGTIGQYWTQFHLTKNNKKNRDKGKYLSYVVLTATVLSINCSLKTLFWWIL
jgi:hypothetical protein